MSKLLFSQARRVVPALLTVLLFAYSPALFALGLGNIKVQSFLNQPLDAQIELLVRPGEDISGITARLASADDYALIGANRESISVPLRFSVDTSGAQPVIRVTSALPVNDPVVRLIVELNWASGRLLREYTLFLDPPVVPAQAPPPVIDQRREPTPSTAQPDSAPSQANVQQAEPASEDLPAQAGETAEAGNNIAAAAAGSSAAEGEYGPVQTGDTLWRIASNWSGNAGANVNQVMLAIQRNNPQAFINNNINLLKRGAILRMPSADEIAAISASAARDEVLHQAELFTGASATTASPSSQSGTQPMAQPVAPAVETPLVDVASEMSSDGEDVEPDYDPGQLEIVPPSEGSAADSAYGAEDSAENTSASTSVDALAEELARKEEALITEQQTNEYLQQRIQELESQSGAADAATVVVEDEELAGMEARLREQREAVAAEIAVEKSAPAAVKVPASEPETPWYGQWTIWIILLLVLVAAAFGWVRSRRGGEDFDLGIGVADTQAEPARASRQEAKEARQAFKPTVQPGKVTSDRAAEGNDTPAVKAPGQAEAEDETGSDTVAVRPASRLGTAKRMDDHEEAHILDEDSADPEVRLDLARAYISMGDREAARAILGEVIEHGDEAQKAEARTMLGGL
jgi:pilus assembly protein FimV